MVVTNKWKLIPIVLRPTLHICLAQMYLIPNYSLTAKLWCLFFIEFVSFRIRNINIYSQPTESKHPVSPWKNPSLYCSFMHLSHKTKLHL